MCDKFGHHGEGHVARGERQPKKQMQLRAKLDFLEFLDYVYPHIVRL